jgi:hypothetical protein
MSVKETKEVLIAANMLSVELIKTVKGGPKLADIGTLLTHLMGDEIFKTALYAAYSDISKLPQEMKTIDLEGGLELAQVQLEWVPKIVAAVRA